MDDLTSFANSHCLPWVLAGDFNEILAHHEGLSNSSPNCKQMSIFNDFLNNYNLLDLDFSGPRFTWTNKRDNGLVMKRLDKVLSNPQWKLLFNKSNDWHLLRTFSNHHLILLSTTPPPSHLLNPKPFCLETMWFNDPSFLIIIHTSRNNHPHNITSAMEDFTHRVKS